LVVLTFTKKCRIIQKARVHKSLAILIAEPHCPRTHFPAETWRERERAQKYFLCVLFADPDWERVSLPPFRSAQPASLAALPTSQPASWWLGA